MSQKTVKILCIGDIFAKSGMLSLEYFLPKLKEEYQLDFVVANGENVAGGVGITKRYAKRIFNAGVDVITLGNHAFSNIDIYKFIDSPLPVILPFNISNNKTKGKESIVVKKGDIKYGVLNPLGNIFMEKMVTDSPFDRVLSFVDNLKKETNIIIVDFHAEATSEKKTMAYYLDGMVSAVVGTHTHVQTSDEQVLPNGTAFITDIGMTGPYDSVIGLKKECVLTWLVKKEFSQFRPSDGKTVFHAVLIEVDAETGKSLNIERIKLLFDFEEKESTNSDFN
ncbi:TIGR00282 family metallophosphoesterase [bacterium]|nr:TIGR00282 family metallophosphoesterase [bacterium]